MPTEAVAAAAVTSRLVFLITPDLGRAEEEELLSDVSIMTRLCTEVRIVYPARKTSTARREDEGKVRAASSQRTNCRGVRSKQSPIEISEEPTIDDRAYERIDRGRPGSSSAAQDFSMDVCADRFVNTCFPSPSTILDLPLGECPNTTNRCETENESFFRRRSEFNAVLDPYQIADTRRNPFSEPHVPSQRPCRNYMACVCHHHRRQEGNVAETVGNTSMFVFLWAGRQVEPASGWLVANNSTNNNKPVRRSPPRRNRFSSSYYATPIKLLSHRYISFVPGVTYKSFLPLVHYKRSEHNVAARDSRIDDRPHQNNNFAQRSRQLHETVKPRGDAAPAALSMPLPPPLLLLSFLSRERKRPTHNARSRLRLATGIESGALFFFGHERKKIICIEVGGTELRGERSRPSPCSNTHPLTVRMIIRRRKKKGDGPPALRVMAPDTNTWVREKGPSPREEGIVYSDYMGSGPGNKPSHGGNGYKIGSMVATVLSRLGLEARPRDKSKATSKKQKDRSTRGDRYTRAKSAWLRGHTTAQGGRGRKRCKAQEEGWSCDTERNGTRVRERGRLLFLRYDDQEPAGCRWLADGYIPGKVLLLFPRSVDTCNRMASSLTGPVCNKASARLENDHGSRGNHVALRLTTKIPEGGVVYRPFTHNAACRYCPATNVLIKFIGRPPERAANVNGFRATGGLADGSKRQQRQQMSHSRWLRMVTPSTL
ncbi:hypothetical protein DBV15_08165 [Temnothorax longispinosus]|uniref:Uncharacterized protein n=1 Tax=Temnothorax longispinosus TaxID=300112 RepID=A0A4S2K9T1_9HYME|nr:hypothetical protein DBV15_08165 [Temnothorax longispinosus]